MVEWRRVLFTCLSVHDECLQVKNLCQLISDAHHADDVMPLSLWHCDPSGMHISICLVFAFCQWLTVYLRCYYSNTGQTWHACSAIAYSVSLTFHIYSHFHIKLKVNMQETYQYNQFCSILFSFLWLKQLLSFKKGRIIQRSTLYFCGMSIFNHLSQ